MAGVGESILGVTVELVVEKVGSYAIQQVAALLGFTKHLNKMKITLQMIKALLVDAERQVGINGYDMLLKEWLAEFKSITYEADDVLDELQYKWLKQEVEGHTQVRKKISSLKTKIRYSSRIQETQKRMDRILALAGQYQLQKLNVCAGGNLEVDEIAQGRVTTSLMGNETVIGRDDKKAEVIRQLMSEHEGVQVLSIYGIGGLGKTTLARYAYNDETIQKHFQFKMWVCVSDCFDVKRLTSEVLESTLIQSKKLNTRWFSEYKSLDELQKAVREELTTMKFLLVLDDVWNEEPQRWEEFKKPFVTAERSENKILVTTRSGEVVRIMSSMKPIELEGLSPNNFWILFKRNAFDGSISESNQKSLEEIGRKILEKLNGLPLAAKTVARLLKSDMSVEHWSDILNSELWKLSENKDDIMPALRLSYQHLPEALKPCFAFLSLFPKDYEFEETMLKEFWIANGFICPQGNKLLEDIAATYTNALLSMCMIQHEDTKWKHDCFKRIFVVHDLLHDLAQIISKDEYFLVRDDEDLKNIPERLRHVNINANSVTLQKLNVIQPLKHARTFVVNESFKSGSSSDLNSGYLRMICTKSKKLRVLVAFRAAIEKVPHSIGQLKHLRYLDLSDTSIRSLPKSLCTLYNLQVLNLINCYKLHKLPAAMTKLVNLRHLYLNESSTSTSSVRSIGKLRSLQELEFSVSKKIGYTIAELKDMDDLRELEIEGLENVGGIEDALAARLVHKKRLLKLGLRWFVESNMEKDYHHYHVLCGLQPCEHLRDLTIYNYGGQKFPSWMENGYFLCIQELMFWECRNLEILTSLQHSQLQTLQIHNCPKLKKLSLGIAIKLLKLVVKDCMELTLDSAGFECLNCLKYLEINNCPLLMADIAKDGWLFPSSLEFLEIMDGCDPAVAVDDELEVAMFRCLQNLPSLSTLNIVHFPITVLQKDLLQHLVSLRTLYISDCEELVLVDIQSLISLRWFDIVNCPKLARLEHSDAVSEHSNASNTLSRDLLQTLSSFRCLNVINCPKFSLLIDGEPSTSLGNIISSDHQIITNFAYNYPDNDRPSELEALTLLSPSQFSFDADYFENVFHRCTSLKMLNFWSCSNLESLPPHINQLPALVRLHLWNCPKIKSLPTNGLPLSLVELVISECELLKESCQKDVGSDWPKISNIPSVCINREQISTGAYPPTA